MRMSGCPGMGVGGIGNSEGLCLSRLLTNTVYLPHLSTYLEA